jgi:hypothetical protein
MRKPLTRILLIWIACIVVLYAGTWMFPGTARLVSLSKSWATAEGTIVGVDRAQHLSITVDYDTVDGKRIEQVFQGSYKNVGDGMVVYYSPVEPSNAALENPEALLRSEIRTRALVSLPLGTFAASLIIFPSLGRVLGWPWTRITLQPRLAFGLIALCVVIASIIGLISGPFRPLILLGDGLAITGTGLLCWRAFRLPREVPWSTFVRSWQVVIAAVLVVAAQFVG